MVTAFVADRRGLTSLGMLVGGVCDLLRFLA